AAQAARIEQHIGEVEKAYQRLQPLIAAGADSVNLAVAYGDVCRSMDRPGDAIAALEDRLARSGGLSVTGRKNLHFCLGNLYDRSGDYDKAFEHYRTGNDLRKVDWDPRANSAQVDAIIRAFSREYLVTAPEAGTRSEKPVFVLGMPRSGTSLVEQILASHPAVHGAGELTDLPQLVQQLPALLPTPAPYPGCAPLLNQKALDTLAGRYLERLDALAPDALRVVDKMPGNFSFLGLIELLFPDARVIHCVRDPVDTCLSCYFQDFSGSQFYSYDLGHLGAFYRDYARLMAHWKQVLRIPMLEVAYEELVADQEAVSRRMIEFCGLDWDERCLQFHENRRFVATSSYDQVRRPIYSSSVDRGRHYRPHLAPLIDALRAEQP
ncbi:MAG TPA: sulfotransferase, partial [Gammaproteobacteria bacterium]|nr:sulfotransferase [Gammaproteobacteria bacterium]